MKILIRAKAINQDFKEETESLKKINGNWYAVGFENPCVQKEFQGIKLCAIVGEDLDAHICDYSTRSINFEDMLDSERNKIFASLSEDGKGGDICKKEEQIHRTGIILYHAPLHIFCFKGLGDKSLDLTQSIFDTVEPIHSASNNVNIIVKKIKVIGIQE